MKRISKYFNKQFLFSPVLLLILLEFVIFLTNYKPGAYLIGWDNIMPEFDFLLNLKRTLFSIWQEYRGLGLLDGLAHSANLVHTLYIGFLSLFLPDSMLRFAYIHLTHLIGGIAFFYLAQLFLKNTKASFIGALFYMLNLGVIQMYFAPLEVFATHFAALPVMIIFLYKSLLHPSRRNFIYLFFASLLTTPQGFVPTVFLSYLVLVTAVCGIFLLKYKNLKQIFLVGIVLFASNAFWLVPYLYSGIKTSTVIQETRINQFASEEIFYRNKADGDLSSVLSLKGFMLDTIEYNPQKNQDVFFMNIWRDHYRSIPFTATYLIILLVAFYGVYRALKEKRILFYPFLVSGFFAFFFLANDTILLSQLNTFIRAVFPVIGEAFRFPFTKFITLFAFCFAIFVALGIDSILKMYSKYTKHIVTGIFSLLLFLSYPVFLGNFTSPLLRLPIPPSYFQLFSYMKTLPEDRRVVIAPLYTFWNWQYRNWGHRGSGFLWYGIRQPITERAFDPWSEYDEQLYNEVSYALNAQDNSLFEKTLLKYDVSYILLDQSMRNTLASQPINYDNLKRFLNASPAVKSKKQFGELTLYSLKAQLGFIYSLPTNTQTTANYYKHELEDVLIQNGNYVQTTTSPDTIQLFPSLATEKLQKDLEFEVMDNTSSFTITSKTKFPNILSNYEVRLPSLFEKEFLIPVSIAVTPGVVTLYPAYPTVNINNGQYTFYEDPIVLTPKSVKRPAKITFLDIAHTINAPFTEKSYLQNKNINAIKLDDGVRQEILYVDTTKIKKQPIVFPLPESALQNISVTIDKDTNPLSSKNVIADQKYSIAKIDTTIHPFEKEFGSSIFTAEKDGVHFAVRSSAKKLVFYKDNLFHQASYLLFVNSDYKNGLPVNFYLDNPFAKRAEVETLLAKDKNENFIVIPKTENFFKGYGFHFTVKSVGKELAQATIQKISLYPFPAQTLKGMSLVKTGAIINSGEKTPLSYVKANPTLYTVMQPPQNGYLVLSQAYDPAWRAYFVNCELSNVNCFFAKTFSFLFGKELKNHVLIDNWANGWEITNSKQQTANSISIIYLPQYFGFLGLLITGLTPILFVLLSVFKLKLVDREKPNSL